MIRKTRCIWSIVVIVSMICVNLISPQDLGLFTTMSKSEASTTDDSFYEDFSGDTLDTDKWLIAYKNWGGKDSTGADYNGGVVPENVNVSNGTLKLEGHGNLYTGNVKGINKDGSVRADGKRVGAAIATKDYFSSGSYEIVAKVAPNMGACSAIWTFEYEEYYPGDAMYQNRPIGGEDYYAVNHEIDIEMPGRPSAAKTNQSFEYALCNTWTGENEDEYTTNYTDIGVAQNDGAWHTYRFDWHTGDTNQTARVDFYFDGILTQTCTQDVPTNAGRLWLGLWFPNEWAGNPNFDSTAFEIDSVRITPFHESGDSDQAESFPNDGWYIPSTYQPLHEDFDGTSLDTDKWLIAYRNWGGKDATGEDYNGGVVPQNVSVSNGTLKLEGHGNNYTGNVKGVNKDGSLRTDGKRVGAAIASKDYFASGSYEIVAKVAPNLGACSAIWTFEYEEYYPGDAMYQNKPVGGEDYYAVNHEIDIEMPGRPAAAKTNQSFEYALCNTWTGENEDEYTCNYTNIGAAQNDGQFHSYRFDWHTGDTDQTARVEFYFDGVLTQTCTTNIPTNAGRLWLGLWFPNEWAGTPNFDTSVFEIDSVSIIPFNEIGDRAQADSFPEEGWFTPTTFDAFSEDFNDTSLDMDKWLIAYRNWGGKDSNGLDYNGGVVPQNVSVSNGTLKLEGHGNLYTGDVKGINKDGSVRSDGRRVGAAIATKDYFASGSYEIIAKVAPNLGACSAIWTFEYEEYYPGDSKYIEKEVGGEDYYAVNHEIDIELPGRPGAAKTNQSFEYALCNTWTGENEDEYTCNYTDIGVAQNDGQFHSYRFDWHTGDTDQTARVDFYFDDVLTQTCYTDIPTNAGRLWLGLWFPNEWAGNPNFDTTVFEIDSVNITPFNEMGDRQQADSFPNEGWYTGSTEYFEENFDGVVDAPYSQYALDPNKWVIPKRNWGGKDANGVDYNGGVVPQNVSVSDGTLKLEAHGNLYTGNVLGINKNGTQRSNGKRVGAAVATVKSFASGSYEVRAKVAPNLGVCSALWTFEYEEYYPGDALYQNKPVGGDDYYAINHEIDIEMPGRPTAAKTNQSFNYALCNTWVGENEDEYTTNYTQLAQAQDDGNWHTYRFDWHTGDTDETARVDFYFDNVLTQTCYTNVPSNSGRFWIAAWFPNEWAGTPNFDSSVLEVDYVKITPYSERGDRFVTGMADPYVADISEYPLATASTIQTPDQVTVIKDNNSATVTWNAVNGATGYDISQNGTVIENVTSPYTISNLANGTYIFKVRAKNATVTGNWSTAQTVTINVAGNNLLQNPNFDNVLTFWTDAVNASVATVAGDNAVEITSTEATGTLKQVVNGLLPNTTYTVSGDIVQCSSGVYGYLGVTNYGGSTIEHGGNSVQSIAPFTFTTGATNTSAIVYLSVYKNQGGSVYFDHLVLTGESTPTIELGIPTLTATSTGTTATLSWTAITGATNYDIDLNDTIISNVTSPYTVIDLTNGTHTFKVRAKNATTTGNWSAIVSVTVNSTPVESLVSNSHFTNGSTGWTMIGSASIANGAAYLSSGEDTDIIQQTITVEPNTTYVLNADIIPNGVAVNLGVMDYNGRYSDLSNTITVNGKETLTFTTGADITSVTIYVQVMRYQANNGPANIDNVILVQQ